LFLGLLPRIGVYDNGSNIVAICTMIERTNGTPEPEEYIARTTNQASSHSHMFTSNVYLWKEELFRSPRNPLKCEELGGVEKPVLWKS
jgi:hypothetical protein